MRRTPRLLLFAVAALSPLALVLAGAAWGGAWAALALVWVTLGAFALDMLGRGLLPEAPEGAEFPAGDGLLVAIALAHFAALPLVVVAVAGPGALTGWERLAVFLAAGLWFGQVANPAAHELIHRADRRLFRLGAAIYASLLFGHHTSAHRLVHHRHAASRQDPNTARAGEGFWRFFPRAWAGSFRAGWRAERGRGRVHPYLWYGLGAALALAMGWLAAGAAGVAVWAGLALHAQGQLLLSDYVQHYGLMRRAGPDGRLEPVGDRHSWNAPHWFTGAMMLNAPRHSDHHAHPARPYPALRLPAPAEAPWLPWPLPVCCLVALVPPWWRRMIAPHLEPWRHT